MKKKGQKFPYVKYLQPMQIKTKLKRNLVIKLEKTNNNNKNNNIAKKEKKEEKKKDKAYLLCNLSKQ